MKFEIVHKITEMQKNIFIQYIIQMLSVINKFLKLAKLAHVKSLINFWQCKIFFKTTVFFQSFDKMFQFNGFKKNCYISISIKTTLKKITYLSLQEILLCPFECQDHRQINRTRKRGSISENQAQQSEPPVPSRNILSLSVFRCIYTFSHRFLSFRSSIK